MEKQAVVFRQKSLEFLLKKAHDFQEGYRQNIAILGDTSTGKSTLLKNFVTNVNSDDIVPVFVEVLPFEFTLFCKRFLNSLLYNYLKKSQLLSSRENLTNLIQRTKLLLPITFPLFENFFNKIEKEKPEILFKELFNLLESFVEESQKKVCIILDEFQNILEFNVKNVAAELGKRIMFEKNTLFIFSSSSKNTAKNILTNDLSLLFGNFEILELSMLDAPSSELLIKNRLEGIIISKEYIHFLIHFTGGHPYYLNALCEEAALQCRLSNLSFIDRDILSSTFEHLLFSDWGIFNLRFSTFLSTLTTGRSKNEFVYILDAIATGKNRLKDLTSVLRKQRKDISMKLNRLMEAGIVVKNGSFYTLNDRLLTFWLKFVYHEKWCALSPDHSEQAEHFKIKINAEMDEFISVSKKDMAERMLDLFNQFEGDDILLDRKKCQLETFKELKILRFENSNLKIGLFGKSQNRWWLTAIKEDGINEQDVNEFILLSKKFKNKVIQKVIIGLGEIERNAHLLAKESRIMTWDIGSLNNLLDLYGQPRIIR
jgi:hypothetical protein